MAVRALRRTNPITLLLAAVLTIGFLIFIFSPSEAASSSGRRYKQKDVATNPLSPPTSPFKKASSRGNGQFGPPPVRHYHLNNLTTSPSPVDKQEVVLILTPLTKFYPEYWNNLLQLSYPHELIALGFIIPKTREGNAATSALQAAIAKTQSGVEKKRFASISILRQDFDPPIPTQNEAERHKMQNQKARRGSMSRARNSLLFTTLGPMTSWVLWLDADIVETPPNLIQDLASFDKPIVVPNCFQRYTDPETKKPATRPYDYNSWQDSQEAKDLAAKLGNDDIIIEGYVEMPTWRTLMAHVHNPDGSSREVIPLDGVGGTALLVKGDVHRDGAMFPPFPFYHLIETEGFARMAKRLGWESWGLPNYLIYHYNE